MSSSAPETAPQAPLHVATADQRRIRPTLPIERLSTFLDFLAEIEEIFGPIVKKRRVGGGDRFLL